MESNTRKKPQKLWTQEEIDFIEKKYGKLTTIQIAKKLNRSRVSVNHEIIRLGLGTYFDNSNELHLEEVARLMHRSHKAISNNWTRRGLPLKQRGKFKMISEKELVKFMKNNQDLWDATDIELWFFEYKYPWVHDKLLEDRKKRDREYDRLKCRA